MFWRVRHEQVARGLATLTVRGVARDLHGPDWLAPLRRSFDGVWLGPRTHPGKVKVLAGPVVRMRTGRTSGKVCVCTSNTKKKVVKYTRTFFN